MRTSGIYPLKNKWNGAATTDIDLKSWRYSASSGAVNPRLPKAARQNPQPTHVARPAPDPEKNMTSSVIDAITRWSKERPDSPALLGMQQAFTYRELATAIERFGAQLRASPAKTMALRS